MMLHTTGQMTKPAMPEDERRDRETSRSAGTLAGRGRYAVGMSAVRAGLCHVGDLLSAVRAVRHSTFIANTTICRIHTMPNATATTDAAYGMPSVRSTTRARRPLRTMTAEFADRDACMRRSTGGRADAARTRSQTWPPATATKLRVIPVSGEARRGRRSARPAAAVCRARRRRTRTRRAPSPSRPKDTRLSSVARP